MDIGAGVCEDTKEEITKLKIGKPYPAPFSTGTHFTISLPHSIALNISVYDVAGRVIKKIHSGKMDKGFHTFTWNGRNNTGNPVASSVYFIVINTGENRITRKVVLVR